MKTQEMLYSKQAYEHPWTESIRMHVENAICGGSGGTYGGNPPVEDDDDPTP